MAHDIKPSTWATRPELAELLERHMPDSVAAPEYDEETGELTSPPRFKVWVPSHSRPCTAYRVRVTFHPTGPGAPHGYVTGVHDLHGCPAHDNGIHCWHLDDAAATVVRDFHHLLPNHGRVGERQHRFHKANPVPADTVPTEAAAGFWD